MPKVCGIKEIAVAPDPRSFGKALRGVFGDFWRYRIGDYRVICDIQDSDIRIVALQIGNRREVYRRK